ncbi:hypothetical protein PMAYCL1PPCAC_15839, partial [Pristionchus mayeri]
SLLCLVVLVDVAFAAPSDRQQKLLKIFGEDINITRAEGIIEEEAKRVGVSTDEYYDACTADSDAMEFTKEEQEDFKSEAAALAQLKGTQFNSRDEVLSTLEQHAPKTYAALEKRVVLIDNYMPKLDAGAQEFVRKFGDFLLDVVVILSNAENDFLGQLAVLNNTVEQLYADHRALSHESKDSLDRTFCINGALRIAANGKVEAFLGFVKALRVLIE